MTSYKLLNPQIKGEFPDIFKGKNTLDVAEKAWNKMSKYFANPVKKFAYTLENQNDKKQYHFVVRETIGGDGEAKYTVSEVSLNNLSGGKKKRYKKIANNNDDDSDSSSDSSSSSSSSLSSDLLYKKKHGPIIWTYNPYIYGLSSVYIPTFIATVVPTIKIITIQ